MRLAMILFSLIATSLMGTAVVVALVMGRDTLTPILAAAGIGFVLSVPVTWAITRQLLAQD